MAAFTGHRTPYGIYRLESPASGDRARTGAHFQLATFEAEDGRAWCIAVIPGTSQSHHFRTVVQAHSHLARSRGALSACGRFIGEALAYVRSRPEGCRSDYLDDVTPGMEEYAADAVEDVSGALARALMEPDPFRAAIVFERSTPYLHADVGLVRLMERILPAFEAGLSGGEFHAAAAADMEAEARGRTPFAAKQVDLWRGSSARPRA